MKILCFGDSNTYGYDPRSCFGGRYPAESRWPDLVADRLGCAVINAGENGRQIPTRTGERQRFAQTLADCGPLDLLIVMLGTNDLLQGIGPDEAAVRMGSFLEQIALEKGRILMIGPPPMKLGAWVPTQALVDASVALNDAYRKMAAKIGTSFTNAGDWHIPRAFDGVHLSESGHAAFAAHLIPCVQRLLDSNG